MISPDPEKLKRLILTSKEPFLFKNILTCEILNWDLEKWNHVLKNQELQLRSGIFEQTKEPQWERKANYVKKSFKFFLNDDKEMKEWFYFDYKYLKDWFTECDELRDSFNWASLGFPDVAVDDCTIWIGSKGAHTPCHKDTYGFNLIFQVYGRKLWVMSPPEENLLSTRIPYEESSIYSKLNFFSPLLPDFKGFTNCRKIILNPGDVLFLPHQWWHYVENLDMAISINVWLPLPQDNEERLKEAVIQFFTKQMVEISDKDLKDRLLNPNMEEIVLKSEFNDLLNVLHTCRSVCKEKLQEYKKTKLRDNDRNYENENVEKHAELNLGIIDNCDFVKRIPKLSKEEIDTFLQEQSSRFTKKYCDNDVYSQNNILEFFEVLSDPDVVDIITQKLIRKGV